MSIGMWGAEYTTGTIPNGWTASGGSMTMDSISWTYSSATYLGRTEGKIQIGPKNNPQTSNWTISTPVSNFGTITNISITAYTPGQGEDPYNQLVGDVPFIFMLSLCLLVILYKQFKKNDVKYIE